MLKDFSILFKETWKEYKLKLKLFLKVYFTFSVLIPLALLVIFGGLAAIAYDYNLMPLVYIFAFLGILAIIAVSVIGTAATIYSALFAKDSKIKLSRVRDNSIKFFWKYLRLMIIIVLIALALVMLVVSSWSLTSLSYWTLLFSIPFTIALIVLFIGLAIYWTFSCYILLDENTKVFLSLRKSFHLVKGKWWRTFGFIILVGLIVLGVYIIIGILQLLFTPLMILGGKGVIIYYTITNIIRVIATAFISPLSIIFIKNLYLDMKLFSLKRKIFDKKETL